MHSINKKEGKKMKLIKKYVTFRENGNHVSVLNYSSGMKQFKKKPFLYNVGLEGHRYKMVLVDVKLNDKELEQFERYLDGRLYSSSIIEIKHG